MLGSAMIETAIGLAFVFLLLSLVATGIFESLASLTKLRARFLNRGIENLLFTGSTSVPEKEEAPGADSESVNYANMLLQHPFVLSMTKGKYKEGKLQSEEDEKRKTKKIALGSVGPSYMPASVFRKALIDILCEVHKVKQEDGELAETLRLKLERRSSKLKGTHLGKVLVTLAHAAEDDDHAFFQEIESWFETGMERVSGWYKRYTQILLFVVGLAMAVGMNADTIRIADVLYQTPEIRASVAAAAADFLEQSEGQGTDPGIITAAQNVQNRMDSLSIPIGWHEAVPGNFGEWLSRILGWLLTALAISFGAPFWFDLLQKFVNLRGAGAKKTGPDGTASSMKRGRQVLYRADQPPTV